MLVLAALVARVGVDPFVRGLAAVSPREVVAALCVTALATVCAAGRWRLVAAGLGDRIPWGRAIAWYYRSQFLNSVLPLGVAGDVHRGLAQGTAAAPRLRGLRGVAWERFSGQAVSLAVAMVVVLLFGPAPLRRVALVGLAGLLATVLVAGVVLAVGPRRLREAIARDLHAMFSTRADAGLVVLTSVLATGAHIAVFVIAAHTVVSWGAAAGLVPVALVVLVGASIPLSLAGWGPREGVAAWAFSIVGLGAGTGVQVAATYGVLALVATLPGLVVVLRAPRREAVDG